MELREEGRGGGVVLVQTICRAERRWRGGPWRLLIGLAWPAFKPKKGEKEGWGPSWHGRERGWVRMRDAWAAHFWVGARPREHWRRVAWRGVAWQHETGVRGGVRYMALMRGPPREHGVWVIVKKGKGRVGLAQQEIKFRNSI
jgi:hypothetical protein